MTRDIIKQFIRKAIFQAREIDLPLKFDLSKIEVECPVGKDFGDYSVNIAMKIAKIVKKSPREVAEILLNQLLDSPISRKMFSRIEIKSPGFINFFLLEDYLQNQVKEILERKNRFGDLTLGKKEKVQVEFISANPTGPLTLGNGRGAFFGDVLANVLQAAGYRVAREYYINDVGEQIKRLGHSILKDEAAIYRGDYIDALDARITSRQPIEAGQQAAKIILEEMIKPLIEKKLKIKFNNWFSEKSLYQSGQIDKILEFLKKKGLTYEKDGALWFGSTRFGDDKDRVLIKKGGEKTYLASDLSYLENKFKRGFKKLIYIWGADHYGYIGRMKAGVEALGYSSNQINFIIMQLVRLVEKGRETRMSKRRGVFVLLEDLIDEVGLDAARFFFLTRAPDSHLNFDLSLAKEQSEKNPVYYIQYAHARMRSIMAKLKIKNEKLKITVKNLKLLSHPSELALIKQLIKMPEIIEDTAEDYQVQRLTQYALDLVRAFHKFYEECRVISEDEKLTQARLSLVQASQITLKNILVILGIKAPEKM